MGTPSGATSKVDKIAIEWKSEDETFITPKSEVFTAWIRWIKNSSMTEFVRPTEDKITIAGDTDTSIELKRSN